MLKKKSEEIENNLREEAKKWYDRAKEIDASIEEEQKILTSDAAKTDRSENAVFQIASDNYARLQISKRDIDNKIEAYNKYNVEYVSSDYITVGSTVALELVSINKRPPESTERVYYVKLVPADLGVAKIGAISTNSAVGRAIQGKYTGDSFKVKTRRGEVEYKILEVY